MTGAVLSTLLFLACLGLIFSEKLNRTIVAFAGAALMIGLGMLFGFYSEDQAIAAIDFNTLGLLLGMMILVALLEPTGVFQYLAVWAGRLSGGKPVRLLILLGTVTTVLSMFLDNVTTVVLIAPVTILICEILGISPLPYLMAEALLSDTGGVATLLGDPPNILIASAAGFSFTDFLTHSLPIVLVAWLVALLLLRYLFRQELSKMPANPDALLKLNTSEILTDPVTTRRVLIVLGAALLVFFFHGILKVSPAFIALSAAATALVWVRPDPAKILKHIEWSVSDILRGPVRHGGRNRSDRCSGCPGLRLGKCRERCSSFVWCDPDLAGSGDLGCGRQRAGHDCPHPNYPGPWRVRDECRSIMVGVGLWSRLWRQWDDHRIDR